MSEKYQKETYAVQQRPPVLFDDLVGAAEQAERRPR